MSFVCFVSPSVCLVLLLIGKDDNKEEILLLGKLWLDEWQDSSSAGNKRERMDVSA